MEGQTRDVLEEEEYTSTLSHIIARDYYPSLHSLRRDQAILDARRTGDVASAVAIRRAARKAEIERDNEWSKEQEEELNAYKETAIVPRVHGVAGCKVHVRKRPRELKHETVNGFHSRVISEDNAEFDANQERERKVREKRLGIIFAAKDNKEGRLMIEDGESASAPEKGSGNLARALLCESPIGLSSDLYDAEPSAGLRITGENKNASDSRDSAAKGIGRNGLFFQPQHLANDSGQTNGGPLLLTAAPSSGTFLSLENGSSVAVAKTATVEGRNTDQLLMPPPPNRSSEQMNDVESELRSSGTSTAVVDKVEYLPKPLERDINTQATRFQHQNESRLLARSTNGVVLNRDGSLTDTSASTDLESFAPLSEERSAYKRAKQKEHDTFVPMTPLIHPGQKEEQLMTWGNVESTPMVLGGKAVDGVDWEPTESDAAPSYDVVDNTSREALARRAERKIQDARAAYRSAGKQNTSASSVADDERSVHSAASASAVDRAASLTPAAQALLKANSRRPQNSTRRSKPSSRIFQSSSYGSSTPICSASRDSFGSALRQAYTPSTSGARDRKKRKHSSSTATSSLRRAAGGATPRIHFSR